MRRLKNRPVGSPFDAHRRPYAFRAETLLSGLARQPSGAEKLMDATNLDLKAEPYYFYLPGA